MHTYDVPRRPSYPSVPSARAAHAPQDGPSATPIYDALYAEYVMSFRSLPGDRSGEEDLEFTAFGNIARKAQWQRVGYVGPYGTGTHRVPAALPPAPRRGA
ncbi:hypothetical protein [Streptomyces glaucus]|uniref:Uncharacterized protein n=1 Tax=Streptomyces glaucus TaxID=284029 RepID=A0ABP5XN78_9ACTN